MGDMGKILIADHEKSFRLVTSESLRREGYACDVVKDGGNAKKALREGKYDLLIADLEMPGNSDLELIRAFRKL